MMLFTLLHRRKRMRGTLMTLSSTVYITPAGIQAASLNLSKIVKSSDGAIHYTLFTHWASFTSIIHISLLQTAVYIHNRPGNVPG